MKLAIAALFAVAASANPFAPKSANNANSKYVHSLLRNAKVIRALAENNNNNDKYDVDISGYSVKFLKCQFVRMYDDDQAERNMGSVLGTSRFALFRLCPSHNCESCNYNYGEYIVDLETYLELTVNYYQQYQEETCNTCDKWCGDDDNGGERMFRRLADEAAPENLDCATCQDECYKIANMQANGYIDATTYLECAKVYENEDTGSIYYAAPICTSGGDKIKIGVFSDEYCQAYIKNKSVDTLMAYDDNGVQYKLSHALLKMTYQDTCITCLESNNDKQHNANDAADADEVNEFCENIYQTAGKCEYSHGFATGYYGVEGYENQWSQEDVVCQYIKSLKAGTYEESGEINLSGATLSIGGGSGITGGQKFALSFFIFGTVGLAMYAAMLHSKLTKGVSLEISTGSLA